MNERDLIDAIGNEHFEPPAYRVQQWHDALDREIALDRGRGELPKQRRRNAVLFWGIALTAALALGIAIGVTLDSGNDVASPANIIADESPQYKTVPASFSRGLQVYLRETQTTLANLPGDTETTLLVMQLIEQNRMYERIAEQSNAPHLARVLRAFEPILLDLAATEIAPEDAESLRAQLTFELNVMLTKMTSQSSDESHST